MSLAPRERLSAGRLAGVLVAASVFLAPPHFAVAAAAPGPQAGLNAYDGEAYLRGQVATAERALREGREAEALDAVDRTLSLVASLRNPEAAPQVVAVALSRALRVLAEAGEGERAWGLYRAAGADVARALPPGLETGLWRLTEARLLQQDGDLAAAAEAADAAVRALREAGLAPEVRDGLLAPAFTLRAVLAVERGDAEAARAALAAHPAAPLYASPGRAPRSWDEAAYLTARALAADLAKTSDPVAAAALRARPAFPMDPATADVVATWRAGGAALALADGRERQTGLLALGRLIRASALAPGAARRWSRPEAVNRRLVASALAEVERADPETAFVLIQLAGRTGPTFDADALTVLAQARDELQRRTLHQALRLTARRDRLERTAVQRAMARAVARRATGVLGHDPEGRLVLRDFNRRLADARAVLARDGLSLTPAPVVPLAAMQRALAPGEAALAAVPAAAGQAQVCVRRDGVVRAFAPVDPLRLKLDTRVVQQALTAAHAPSEELDAQFPAEAAVRLHDALIRPLEGCLKRGDRIL